MENSYAFKRRVSFEVPQVRRREGQGHGGGDLQRRDGSGWTRSGPKRKARPSSRRPKADRAQPHQLRNDRERFRRHRRVGRPQGQDLLRADPVSRQSRGRHSHRSDRPEARAEGRPQRRDRGLATRPPGARALGGPLLFGNITVTDCVPLRPQTYNGDITKLPPALAYLRAEKVWLCWCWSWNGKKWTKPPRRVDDPSRNASTSDPTTWGTYEQAVAQVRDGGADGIGFALKDRNIGGVDLDHCRDPATGQVE